MTELLRTRVVGSGPRKLLVLPGWRLDSETEVPEWSAVIESRSEWSAVFVDLPGTGLSRGLRRGIHTQRDMLEAVLRVIDHELGSGPLAVAGTSNGAALALAIARARVRQVRGLAVRVPMLEPNDEQRAESGQAQWQAVFDALPESYRAAHAHKIETMWEPARSERTEHEFLAEIREDPDRYALPIEPITFAGPALVVLGRQDARVGWQHAWSLLGNLPRATVVVLDRAGHALPVGASQVTLWRALADDWLDRLESAPSG